jgi:hypothetical protein
MNDKIFALIYGPSGIGKTTDCGYSFPNGLFLAAPGALQPIQSLCGYKPSRVDATTLQDATKLLSNIDTERHDAFIVDDFSYLAELTFAKLEKRYNGFTLWGKLRDIILGFRDAARYAKVHVILNCWEQGPKTKPDGSRVRGGPMLSGKLPEQLPAMCDLVLRGGHEPLRKPWPGVLRCFPDPNYVMKDRLNTARVCDPAPMNLGELLRASGLDVSRHQDLDWQEEVVSQASSQLISEAGNDADIANGWYQKLLEKGISPNAARWTLRDALDRAVIDRALNLANSRFI